MLNIWRSQHCFRITLTFGLLTLPRRMNPCEMRVSWGLSLPRKRDQKELEFLAVSHAALSGNSECLRVSRLRRTSVWMKRLLVTSLGRSLVRTNLVSPTQQWTRRDHCPG